MLIYLSLIESESDKSKFEIIYDEYKLLMFDVANRILGDTKDSEDVVHQAFLSLIENFQKVGEPKCPQTRGLIVTIVERKAIDLYRRRKRLTFVSMDEEYINVPMDSDVERVSERTAIAIAIAALPTRYREVLMLKYDSGFTEKEIANMMSMSPANVKKTVQRAKQKLAALLEEQEV